MSSDQESSKKAGGQPRKQSKGELAAQSGECQELDSECNVVSELSRGSSGKSKSTYSEHRQSEAHEERPESVDCKSQACRAPDTAEEMHMEEQELSSANSSTVGKEHDVDDRKKRRNKNKNKVREGNEKKVLSNTSLYEANRFWKTFSDEDFRDINPMSSAICNVPERSFFTITTLSHQPITIANIPPKTLLPELLRDMIEHNKGATTQIVIDSIHFECMPTLLKCYSVWFANRDWRLTTFKFTGEDVPAEGFRLVYEWMRFQVRPTYDTVVPMLQVAKHLQVDILQDQCWDLLADESIREKRGFHLYLQSKGMPALDDVRDLMLARLRFYFLPLVGHDDFLNLDVEDVVSLLKLDTIGVNSEVEVFFSVLRWLNKAPEQRQKHLRKLMACVRFCFLPMFFLFSLKQGCNREDKRDLFKADPMLLAFHMDPQSQDSLEKAIAFVGVRCQYSDNEEFYAVCGEHNMHVDYPRRWIKYHKCLYHTTNMTYPFTHNFTATDFSDFIASIQADWVADMPEGEFAIDIKVDENKGTKEGKKKKKRKAKKFKNIEPIGHDNGYADDVDAGAGDCDDMWYDGGRGGGEG
ncbi:uncharacterized protein LOC115627850 [Scaptodrosophila lebanonensis]|uniref:Uncharacterized protein LOC115627850 n=1 Tax=Drosophila lebanonensis TaxID=7225 RepID=A0A6J2TVJ2_DROLE|nr:uncharacterized protein LOC115627850 [Scaptodrosophila lebanonensis]